MVGCWFISCLGGFLGPRLGVAHHTTFLWPYLVQTRLILGHVYLCPSFSLRAVDLVIGHFALTVSWLESLGIAMVEFCGELWLRPLSQDLFSARVQHWSTLPQLTVNTLPVSLQPMRHSDSVPSVYGSSILWLSGFAKQKLLNIEPLLVESCWATA